MKKIFTFLFALLATTCLLAQDFKFGDLCYNITSSTTVEVTHGYYPGGYSNLATATIPETVTYNGTTYSVTSIESYAFDCCSSLTSVTIPNSVTSIGEGAFSWCSSLTKTNYTGDVAGWCNINFDGVYANPMFYSHNFYINDQEIKDLVIPNSVTSIGNSAFYGCSSLTSVTIPNSITSIGDQAFRGCSSLASMVVESGNTTYDSRENCNAVIETATNTLIAGCQNTIIPNSVTSIGDYAFYYCSSLTSITIPNSVTSIGSNAFSGCSSLEIITIGNSVTHIGYDVFERCSSLTSVIWNAKSCSSLVTDEGYWYSDRYITPFREIADQITTFIIGEDVKSIPNNLCCGMSIDSIVIPNNVTQVGGAVFWGCSSLKSVTLSENISSLRSIQCTPSNSRGWYDGFFEGCYSLTTITIPKGIKRIDYETFNGCPLTSIIWNAQNCDDFAYESRHWYYGSDHINTPLRSTIKSITFGKDVQHIPAYLCYNLQELTSITISENIKTIGQYAFLGCNSLESVIWEAKACTDFEPTDKLVPFYLISPQITSFTFGDSVEHIPAYICNNMSNLTTITIPNNVISIGCHAFYETGVYNNDSNWENGVLYINNCIVAAKTDISGTCQIKDDIRLIADAAFYDCDAITSTTIPNSVTSIGKSAFYDCDSLTLITLNSNAIVSKTYNLNSDINMDDMFGSQVQEYVIGDSVTSVGNYAFHGCSGLTSVTISNNVLSIGESAFLNCCFTRDNFINNSSLDAEKNNYWGAKIADIETDGLLMRNDTVIQCRPIVTSVTIPESVTSIGEEAFYWCSALTSIYLPYKIPIANKSSFNDYHYEQVKLYVPLEAYEAYKADDVWGNFKDIQYIDNFYANNIHYKYMANGEILSESLLVERNFNKFTTISIIGSQNWHYDSKYGAKMSGYDDNMQRTYPNEDWLISPPMDLSKYSSATLEFSHAFGPAASVPTTATQKSQYTCWVSNDFNGDVATATWTELPITYGTSAWSFITTRVNIPAENLTENCHIAWKYECINSSATWEIKSVEIGGLYTKPAVEVIDKEDKYSNDIIIPSTVTHNYADYDVQAIAANAFSDCASLTSITIGNNVTSIESSAFSGCTALNEITLSASVKSIGENAFAGCTKLYDIYCYSMEPPTAYDSSFANYNAFLHVPCDNQRVYLLDVLFGNFKYIECIEAETTPTDTVVVTPSFNDAEFIWPSNSSADSYTLAISKDGEVFCTLTFNANGQLTGIAFAPSRNGQHNAPAAAQTANGFAFTVTGLDEGANYTYELLIQDRSGNTLLSYSGEFRTQSVDDRIIMVEYDATQGEVIGAGTYLLGDIVTLTVIPNEGYQFATWGDGNTDNPRTLVVTQDTTLTAVFEILTYNVIVTCDPIHGYVTGSGTYNHGDVATLTATPSEGYTFVEWGDGCTDNPRALVVTQDTILTALFDVPTYNITVTCDPIHGYVTGSGTYNHGDVATLTATPSEGYTFVEWGDGCTDNPRALMVTQDTTLTAIFEILTYNVTVTYDPIHGSVTGSGTYNHGDVVTLTAIPNEGYQFVRWSNEVEDNPYTFVISDNVKLSAEFEAVIHSSVENTHSSSPTSSCQKIFRNGQLLILRDGKTYNVMGQGI